MKTKFTLVLVLAASALMLSPLAKAQVQPNTGTDTSPFVYGQPPVGFDPTTASDAELDEYGFPPRPSVADTAAYSAWVQAVTGPQTRLTSVVVQPTNINNGVAQGLQEQGTIGNVTGVTSSNWSGAAITAANGTFKKNDSFVYAQYLMPAVGVDNCKYKITYYMSEWVGIDGFNNGDVLQAGTQSTACGTSYVAWYEWFTSGCTQNTASLPCSEWIISNLPVGPGDYLTDYVWYTTSSPHGHAYLLNFTTGVAVSIGFNQPAGNAPYAGDSVEWIVERPEVGGSLANLTNYLGAAWDLTYAYNGTIYVPGGSVKGSTVYNITMTCPPWNNANPSFKCKGTEGLSWTQINPLLGNPSSEQTAIWNFVEGPAYQ